MKKIFLAIPILIISVLVFSACTQSEEVKEAFNKGYSETEQKLNQDEFSKDEALVKVQNYRITVDLEAPSTPKGTAILEYYEKRGKTPAIENIGWFTEEVESGKYIVSYKQKVGNLESNPRWEVTKDEIRAVNGIAITITPEFGPQEKEIQGTDLEKQVYQTYKDLYSQYETELIEEFEIPTGDQLDEIDKTATQETANQYEITTDEVSDIYIKLDVQRFNN